MSLDIQKRTSIPHLSPNSFFKKQSNHFFPSRNVKSTEPFFKGKSVVQPKLKTNKTGENNIVEADAITSKITKQPSSLLENTLAPPKLKENTVAGSHINNLEQKNNIIQREDDPVKKDKIEKEEKTGAKSGGRSSLANRCYTSPTFPNFRCLANTLKLNIEENLWNNAYRFYHVASLYPNDNELMWNTFMRYGLGSNLLQTGFHFLGAGKTLGSVLTYGTGIGLKSFEFYKNGVLQLDIPIPIGNGVRMDLQFDLNANPDNLREVKGVSGGVGFTGHF